MDLKSYYQKIREIESRILDAVAVIVSLETPDGGRPGVLTEVPPGVAARMVVEGTARLASAAEADSFRRQQIPVRPDGPGSTAERGEDSRKKAAGRSPKA